MSRSNLQIRDRSQDYASGYKHMACGSSRGLMKNKSQKADKLQVLTQKPIAFSLFSGGGGLDIGMEQAGFQPLCCIEIDPHCCTTLTHNQPAYLKDARIINSDVRKVSPDALMRDFGLVPGELDLLYGGPPCQSFSQIGKQDGLSDDRGLLLFEMARFAQVLRPKVILIENVKALGTAKDLNGERGGVLKKLLLKLHKLGYATHVKVVNSAEFGVAQLRERIFIVAVQAGYEFEFPESTHGPNGKAARLTVGNALKGLRKPVGKEQAKGNTNNHVDITPAGDRLRISFVSEGSYLACANAPAKIKGRLSKKDTTKFLRLSRSGQSNTLRCGEIFFHPLEDRYLTPREYMRIHGFPDDYYLQGPIRGRSGRVRHLDQHRQVANSVPPPVAKAVATQILQTLSAMSDDGD